MRKKNRPRFALPLLLLVIFLLFGIEAALSQFATSPPSGAYHNPSDIVCNDCISSQNIGSGAVGTSEIADAAIADQDISATANINPTKINHPTGLVFSFTVGSPNPVSIPQAATIGVSNWQSRPIETLCGPVIYSGIDSLTFNSNNQVTSYRTTSNHYVSLLPPIGSGNGVSTSVLQGSCNPASCSLPGTGWVPLYDSLTYNVAAGSPTPVYRLMLFIRVDPVNPAQLEIGEIATPASAFIPLWSRCMIRYVQ